MILFPKYFNFPLPLAGEVDFLSEPAGELRKSGEGIRYGWLPTPNPLPQAGEGFMEVL